jgi:hypothetical protein
MNILQIFAILLIFKIQAPVVNSGIAQEPVSDTGYEADCTESELEAECTVIPSSRPYNQEQRATTVLLSARIERETRELNVHAVAQINILREIFDDLAWLRCVELSLKYAFPMTQIEPLAHQLYEILQDSLLEVATSLNLEKVQADDHLDADSSYDRIFSNAVRPMREGRHPKEAQLIAHIEQKIQPLEVEFRRNLAMLREIAPSLAILRGAESRIAILGLAERVEAHQACQNLEANLLDLSLYSTVFDLDRHAMRVIETEIEKLEGGAENGLEGNAEEHAARLEEIAQRRARIADLEKEIEIFEDQIKAPNTQVHGEAA